MMPKTDSDPEYPKKSGSRLDGKNLIEMWEEKIRKSGHVPKYVWNKEQFDSLNLTKTDRLLGKNSDFLTFCDTCRQNILSLMLEKLHHAILL